MAVEVGVRHRRIPRALLPVAVVIGLCAAIVSGCSSTTVVSGPPATDRPTGTTVPPADRWRLGLHRPVEVVPGVTIEIIAVADSRCPADVECVWAGDIDVDLRWDSGGVAQPLHLRWHRNEAATPAPDGAHWLTVEDLLDEGGRPLVVLRLLDHPEPVAR